MKQHASTLTLAQLDWCLADIAGRALRKAQRARDADVRRRKLPFKMWEAIVGTPSDPTSHSASPITVTRYGPLSEGAPPTITFLNAAGLERTGSVDHFFAMRDEAVLEARGLTFGYAEGFHPATSPQDAQWVRSQFEGGEPLEVKFYRLPGPTQLWECRMTQRRFERVGVGETDLIAYARACVMFFMGLEVEVPCEAENL